jgi:hypothetical protein
MENKETKEREMMWYNDNSKDSDVLLTVHLSIILVNDQFNAQILVS